MVGKSAKCWESLKDKQLCCFSLVQLALDLPMQVKHELSTYRINMKKAKLLV